LCYKGPGLDFGRFTPKWSEIEEAGTTDFSSRDYLNLFCSWAVEREGLLNTDVVRNLADREGGIGPTTAYSLDHHPLKHLGSLFVAFNDSSVYTDGVARTERGNIGLK
jgi:hypothetical protein